MDGKFKQVKTRSVPCQPKSYKTLLEVVKKAQRVLELKDVEGTLVGIKSPAYTEGVFITGCHMHFITKDRKFGGHVMEVRAYSKRLIINGTGSFIVHLLSSSKFYKAKLGGGEPAGLKMVEQGKSQYLGAPVFGLVRSPVAMSVLLLSAPISVYTFPIRPVPALRHTRKRSCRLWPRPEWCR